MALKTVPSEHTIFKKGDKVTEIALVLKGSVSVHIGNEDIVVPPGSIVGLGETAGTNHKFSYVTKGETTYYTYPYNSPSDIISLISENEKIAPAITMALVRTSHDFLELCINEHHKAHDEYEIFLQRLKDYPELCAKTGHKSKDFSKLSKIEAPDFPMEIIEWKSDFFSSLTYHVRLLAPVYTIGPDACTGFVMMSVDFMHELADDVLKIMSRIEAFSRAILEFTTEYNTLSNEADAIDGGSETIAMPSMENSLDQILMYAGYDPENTAEFKDAVNSYASTDNRSDTNDTLRNLRRQIAKHYYPIYKLVFKRAIKDGKIPAIIKMFLNYGYMDERIVTSEDLKYLYGLSQAYEYNGGKIIPIFNWLKLIYALKVDPSLNEFQMDYPTYLREAKQNGEISEEEQKSMLEDPEARLDYEIKNLFTLGNRMTFGRISMFVPIFDSELRMLPLNRSFLSNDIISEEINRVRELDHTIFYRTKIWRMEENETIQFFIHEEQTPYIIIFPVCGQNMILWQTIEGRKRNTPARMFMPAFFEENVSDSITKVCADYRWEVCKTDQGVRWTDITDPSLTAEYHDLLQFYKKNASLSAEHKEKIKTTIKKYANNYKKVFINDYLTYIKYEAAGNMRLLKNVREILFKYCTFGKETREKLSTSPQYEKLIEIRMNKLAQQIRPLQNVIQKEKSLEHDAPAELLNEIEYLNS